MNPEQIIAHVCAALDAQGEKSKRSKGFVGGCAYRGKNRTKCAVGHLIPDDQYNPTMEGLPVGMLCNGFSELPIVREVLEPNIELLNDLQHCHDCVWNPMKETFTEAWKRYSA